MNNNNYHTVHIPESCHPSTMSHTDKNGCFSTKITLTAENHIHEIKFIKSVCCVSESLACCVMCIVPFSLCLCVENVGFCCFSKCSKKPLTRHAMVIDGGSQIKKIEKYNHDVDVHVSKSYAPEEVEVYQFRNFKAPTNQLMG